MLKSTAQATSPYRVAVVGTVLIALGAFWLSFSALADLARQSGVPAYQAWVWPLIVDGLILIATVSVVAFRGSRYARYAWVMLAAGSLASIAANAAHASTHGWVAQLVASTPPLVLLAMTELIVKLRRHALEVEAQAALDAELERQARESDELAALEEAAQRAADELADRQAWEEHARQVWEAEHRDEWAQWVAQAREEWEAEEAPASVSQIHGLPDTLDVKVIAANLLLNGASATQAAARMNVSTRQISAWTKDMLAA